MSYRQSIHVFHPVNVEQYLAVLQQDYGARPNPEEPGAYLIGDPPIPFYTPTLIDNQLSIVGFNHVPLPPSLLEALATHPDLVPPMAEVQWLEEQDLLADGTLADMGQFFGGKEQRG